MTEKNEIMRLSWWDYYQLSKVLAAEISRRLRPETKVLQVVAPELLEGLLALGAAAQLELTLLFDEKASAESEGPDTLRFDKHWLPPAVSYQGLELYPSGPSEALPFNLERLRVIFKTSGSTGQPKRILKHGSGLVAETEVLARVYGLEAEDHIVGLVRPFHLYGFLHAFLLPLKKRAKITLWPVTQHLPSAALPTADLLVAVPSQWSFVEAMLEQTTVKRFVSSGAPFGLERAERLRRHPKRPVHAWEIIGSTETGGLGTRRIGDRDDAFELLDGVEIEECAIDGSWIRSPFLDPEVSAFTADRFELIDAGTFRHLGRADRIFKYAGKRYSLTEIEEALSRLYDGAAVVCHYTQDLNRAQGGTLKAWIEGDPALGKLEKGQNVEMRTRFLARHTLPFPQLLLPIEKFPRDAQGKVQLEQLLKLAR